MAYAIIRSGGKQYRVDEGATLRLPSLAHNEVGDAIELEALVVGSGDEVKLGETLGGALVKATVVAHGRGEKIIVFKKKRRKQYKRKQGHRQGFTSVKIDSIG